jgi:hypothetical protein
MSGIVDENFCVAYVSLLSVILISCTSKEGSLWFSVTHVEESQYFSPSMVVISDNLLKILLCKPHHKTL